MLSQSFFITVLFASAILAADPPPPTVTGTAPAAGAEKPLSAGSIPECATLCMTTKITEAATWYGKGELAIYCTHPNFLVAYNTCLNDHCHGQDLTLGQQAGAAACGTNVGALTAPIPPAVGVTGPGSTVTSSAPTDGSLPANRSMTNGSMTDGSMAGMTGSHSGNTTTIPTGADSSATITTGMNHSMPVVSVNSTNTTTGATTPRFGTNSSTTKNNTAAGSAPSPASIVRVDLMLLSTSIGLLITSFFF